MCEFAQNECNVYGYIYKISNLVDEMVYVGQTKCAINRRWTEHKRDSKNDKIRAKAHSYLHNAMFKYGANNFAIEVLDTGFSREELNEKEKYWIQELSSLSPNGYNIRPGGWDSTFTEETINKLSKISRDRWACPEHRAKMIETVKKINGDPAVVQKHRINSLKMWEDPDYRSRHTESMKTVRERQKILHENRKAKTGKAWTEEHCRKISISKTGKRINKTENEKRRCSERFIRLNKERHADRWFAVFDFYGKMIGRFNSFEICASYLGVGSDQVQEWANGKHRSVNYRLAMINKDTGEVGDLVGGALERIRVYDLDGIFIGDFNSKTSCGEQLKVARKTIDACMAGTKSHKKYIFRLVKYIGINRTLGSMTQEIGASV